MNTFKNDIVAACTGYFIQKINSLQSILRDIEEATNSETKSTAGDKHETGRAMMQLEREKLGKQLLDLETQFSDFQKNDFSKPVTSISQGCLIETNKGWFFIAAAIGKMTVKDKTVFVISEASPLGKCLEGLKPGNKKTFNQTEYSIGEIY